MVCNALMLGFPYRRENPLYTQHLRQRITHETHLSAVGDSPEAYARFSRPYENPWRTQCHQCPPRQGSASPGRLAEICGGTVSPIGEAEQRIGIFCCFCQPSGCPFRAPVCVRQNRSSGRQTGSGSEPKDGAPRSGSQLHEASHSRCFPPPCHRICRTRHRGHPATNFCTRGGGCD